MVTEKKKFFEIIRNVSESEGLNKDNLLERIGSELKGVNPEAYSTYNNLKIDKLFIIQDSDKAVNCMLLHLAVECNSVPVVKLLLEKKVKVNEQISGDVNSKFTALHIAALHGHQEIVQLLLDANTNPSLKDSQGRTPRDIVGDVKGKNAIIEMLERATLTRDNENTKASVMERVLVLEKLLKENNNGNNTDKVDDTLEREQAIRERDAMAQKLKEAEQQLANNQKRIEHDDLHNQHPEHYTTYNEEQTSSDLATDESSNDSGINTSTEDIGKELEKHNTQDENGLTSLHHAVANGDVKTAKYLIDNGADVDAQDRDGYTPLHYAAAGNYKELAKLLIKHGANVNAQDRDGHTPLYYAVANYNKELAKLLIKHGADRSLIKDEDLIDRLNSMCDQPSEVVPSTFAHSKTHNATETPEKAEKVEKRKAKLKELCTQLKDEQKKNELLKQQIQNLKSKNTTLNSELEKTKTKTNEVPLEKAQKELAELRNYVTGHGTRLEALNKLNEKNESLKQKIQDLESKNATLNSELEKTKTKTNEVPLEKVQKELTELRSYFTGHGARLDTLEKLNEENESLKQKIKSLENENTPLKGELGKTKTKTNKLSLEKVGKRQFSPRVAYASLAAMLAVGAALSIASGLSALLIVAASVVSALIAGGVTYAMSTKPTTELKEVDIQGSAQHGVCKT
ncbi:MAG: ankyrin repeat domain-containing protein [Wolbachia pipientis]|jgi:ankyrin repeat protein|nr:ankyrin repeat domain-containing protein [Wolbachia pipientis]